MAIKNLSIITFLTLALISCNNTLQEQESMLELSDNAAFTLKSTIKFNHQYKRPDGSIAFANFEAPKNKYDTGDITVEIYNKNIKCNQIFTGSSELKEINQNQPKVFWGLVDIYERYKPNFDFPPEFGGLCRPFLNGAAYVLCSEHKDRSALVCLSQATKNSEQAKQIFETFRWTE